MTQRTLRATTYNMRQGGSREHWQRILLATEPDLLLVQETREPALYAADLLDPLDLGGALWRPAASNKWGSSLLVRGGTVNEIAVPGFEGWVTGGEVRMRDASLIVFSVHVPGFGSNYVRTGHRIMDALADIIADTTCILGGDWNFTPCLRDSGDQRGSTKAESEFLRRLEQDFNLLPAWRAAHPEGDLPQTLRWMRDPSVAYHCDGFFTSPSLMSHFAAARVIAGPPWIAMSDHNPMVFECEWEDLRASTPSAQRMRASE